ncbi:hypothetical protein [Oceanobacillus damuensis]|uniref:hypothetical protein n=1 Tax=Oceanobacillus damuensis TaxID=937928 RepID=UPI0008310C78|nr:hypothetical protein [Oceanobacillus damuensis]
MKLVIRLFMTGIISGLILGGFLKLAEQWTSKKVYVLLMNIDYFPVVGEWVLSGTMEFSLHLIVSVVLVYVLYIWLKSRNIQTRPKPYIIINTLIGGLLYGTTALSERTPRIADLEALFYWLAGHMLYGFVVWILIVVTVEKERSA